MKQEVEYHKENGKVATSQPNNEEFNPKGKRKVYEKRNSTALICGMCGGNHRERGCYWKNGPCLKCGKLGHVIKDCPKLEPRN